MSQSSQPATTASTASTAPTGFLAEFPAARTAFSLPGPVGKLECLADVPESEIARPATAIICHPHSLHGGSLQNKVVSTLDRSFRELGLRSLRFNFRGVGESEGSFDEGRGEADDLQAAIDWVRKVRPDDTLWLAGFSFGCFVSLLAAQRPEQIGHLAGLVHIAPAVGRFSFGTLLHPRCPWLVVAGTADELVPIADTRAWIASLEPRPDYLELADCSHFFHGRLVELRELLKTWLNGQLPTPAAP